MPRTISAPIHLSFAPVTVVPGTGNAVWGTQCAWPIEAEYVIVDLDPRYTRTIIGRSKRDYVWLMARTPTLPRSAAIACTTSLSMMKRPS